MQKDESKPPGEEKTFDVKPALISGEKETHLRETQLGFSLGSPVSDQAELSLI